MKFRKSIAIILIVTIFAAAMSSGCTATEKITLLNALEKTSNITSYEAQSMVMFDFDITGLPEEYQGAAEQFMPLLRNIKIQAHQVINRNVEKTRLNSRSDITITSSALTDNMTVWSTLTPGNTAGLNQIVRLPSSLSSQLPSNLAGKEYMVISGEGLNQPGTDSFSDMTKSAADMQTKIINFLKSYAIQYDSQFPYVTYKGRNTINNVPADMYEIKLTNESLKSLVRHALYDAADNEDIKNSIKDLVYSMINVSGSTDAGTDLDLAFSKLRDGSSSFKEDVDRIRVAFRDVEVLGDKGITLSLAVSDEGYIIDQNGVMDLVLDTAAIDEAMEKLYAGSGTVADSSTAGSNMVLGATLTFDSYIYNINKDIAVEYPELNSANSFDFTELLGGMPSLGKISSAAIKDALAEAKGGSKPVNKALKIKNIKTELIPLKINNCLMVPLSPVCKEIEIGLTENKNGTITLTKGKTKLVFFKGSSEVKINNRLVEMELPAVTYEKDVLVPVGLINNNFNCVVDYDKKRGLVILLY